MKTKLLKFGSLYCPAYILIMVVAIMAMPFFVDIESDIPASLLPIVVIAMILLLISVIGTWFFIVFDIIHAAKHPGFSRASKIKWIAALWLLNVFVIPIYWIKYLRKDPSIGESGPIPGET